MHLDMFFRIGQKVKFKKPCQNNSTNNLEMFCAKKNSKNKNKCSRNETILKIGHYAKAFAHPNYSL